MIPEIGHLALIIAFVFAMGLAVIPMWGAVRGNSAALNLAPTLATGRPGVCGALPLPCSLVSFLNDDFSVAVVAANSNSLLPAIFKFSALWGNHEGSLLLWVLILSGWMAAVSWFSQGLPSVMVARVLSVMGMIAVGFLAFSLLTSNPFERLLPNIPLDGNDLNPLLQDPGLIIHPPLVVHGLRWIIGAVRLRDRGVAGGQIGCLVGEMVASMDQCGLGIFVAGDHAGKLVGLLRIRMGWLVVLGSG